MNKNDLRNKMQSGFLEAAPDVYEAVLKAAEKNRLLVQDTEFQEKDEKNRLLTQDTQSWKAEGLIGGSIEKDTCKEQGASSKGNVIWGNFSKYVLSACAGFALFFICLFGMLGKNEESIYVVMDINPSIQIVMNESCQVRALQGLNQDGKNVVNKLEWKKKDSLFQTVDVLLEDVVKDSYLREGNGILVTVFTEDKALYQDLETSLATKIDGKLEVLEVSHVTTAFQFVEGGSAQMGRKLLEAELAENTGADKEKLQQMTVMELIQYCQEATPGKLELSPLSQRQQQEVSGQIEDDKNSQKKGSVPQNTKKNSVDKEDTSVKNGANKEDTNVGNDVNKEDTDVEDGANKKEADVKGAIDNIKDKKPSQPQPESPSQPQEEPSLQEYIGSEQGVVTKDKEDKKENKNKGNKDKNNKDKNNKNKDKNNKDKTNNKDNENKDKNNKDNKNKDKNNKNNGNKDKNNKDNDNKNKNYKDSDNKINNNRDNDNKASNSSKNGRQSQ